MPITLLEKGKGPEARKIKRKMGMMNVSLATGLENQQFISTSAKMLEQKTSENAGQRAQTTSSVISEQASLSTMSQFSVLKASTQITLNNSLKETLKYLQAHANDRRKEHIFGELWKILSTTNEEAEKNPYR